MTYGQLISGDRTRDPRFAFPNVDHCTTAHIYTHILLHLNLLLNALYVSSLTFSLQLIVTLFCSIPVMMLVQRGFGNYLFQPCPRVVFFQDLIFHITFLMCLWFLWYQRDNFKQLMDIDIFLKLYI